MLLVRINIQQHNKNDARTDLQEASTIADQLQDKNLKEYLEKCLEVVETIEFDDLFGPKMLEKREQKMLSMMSTPKMKDEFAHLFRMMSAMPASRRLTVMPGVRMDDSTDRKKSRAMSIIPGNEREDQSAVKQRIRMSKGVGFMELVQYHV
nr:unnamed protein product [Callosobruchus chinensis]